ncbi:MAG: diguanylate cyclase [Candidatus Omnitrophica bacterium]|nr:diguanylate cyclase [Candidatus Omnitrophota bacterium]
MKPLTLQGKTIMLLLLFTIAIIVVFVAVQLWHELEIINAYKESEAQILTLTVENIWEKISNLNTPQEMKIILIQKKLNSLKEKDTIREAYIFDNYGEVVASTGSKIITVERKMHDISILNKLEKGESIKGEMTINKKNQEFSFYVPLEGSNKDSGLIVRLFFSLGTYASALQNVLLPAVIIGLGIGLVNIFLGVFLSKLLIGPIQFFNEAASKIASGRFDLRVHVKTEDEIEELADTFNYMTAELVKMQQRAMNANPLTKLPGNIVIMEQINQRISQGVKFTVIYCDLDHFKAFNDKYGIHKGDEAIKLSGDIFKEAVKSCGNTDDFLGHEGGDDFILITTPDKSQAVADYIISEFDKRIRSLYSEEDLKRGYIAAHDRDGTEKKFPIMSISLAGVTNMHREITSYAQVTNIAAEVKKKSKSIEKSYFTLDKRTN